MSEHSAHLTPLSVDFRTWLWRYTYLLLLISKLWHRQAIFKSKGDKLCSSAECRIWTRGPRHQIASRLNALWQTDWAIEDQAKKTWTRQPVPMISGHSTHLTPLSVDFRTWRWRYTYLLLLISMLWHRQAIFKSKGDKLCSSAEFRIWIRGPRHQIASRLNDLWQTDWAIEDQAKKNLNSTARPYDQRAFSPLDPTVSWLSHLALAIYIFVVVNFDALAQASDIQIERRQVVFLCWMQDLNPGSQTPNRQQTECSWTNRLSYRGSWNNEVFLKKFVAAVYFWHVRFTDVAGKSLKSDLMPIGTCANRNITHLITKQSIYCYTCNPSFMKEEPTITSQIK